MEKLQVVFMPCPAIGHLISMMELAKKLDPNRFSVTVLNIPQNVDPYLSAVRAHISSVTSNIRFHDLPFSEPPPKENQKMETYVTRLIEAYKAPVKEAVSSISAPVVALIVDCFCSCMIDVANELDIPGYVYFPSNATMVSVMLHAPRLLHVDVGKDIYVPGLPPVPPRSMLKVFMDKNDEAYDLVVGHGRKCREAKGLIVNSFTELEAMQVETITKGGCLPDCPTPQLFPVGPLIATEPTGPQARKHHCIDWLDRQPAKSVVAICFGSTGAFEAMQVREIAMGLERSGHRFLWAIRSPGAGAYKMVPVDANLEEVMPDGFLERTKDRGLVWPSWVPQVEILAHAAVGGFVTHCGWNSVLESLWFGVPMLGWPLHSEQHLNCFMMATEMGVAIQLEFDKKNGVFVSSEELEKGVRVLMGDSEEGIKLRAKVEEIKAAGRRATMVGGSSYGALENLMGEFEKKMSIAGESN